MIDEMKPKTEVSARILDVARELFIANGYSGTSVRDIASASGANVAHIKYYYESKSKLFEIIFDEAFDILVDRVFSTFNSNLPFYEMIEQWIHVYYELLPQYPQIPLFVLNEISHNPEALVEKINKKNPQEIFTKLALRLEEEIAKGTVKNVPPVDLGLNILSLCVFPFMFSKFAMHIADKTDSEYYAMIESHKRHVVDFAISALKP